MFDTMPLIYEKLGAKTLYERIQMRPGAAPMGPLLKKDNLSLVCRETLVQPLMVGTY